MEDMDDDGASVRAPGMDLRGLHASGDYSLSGMLPMHHTSDSQSRLRGLFFSGPLPLTNARSSNDLAALVLPSRLVFDLFSANHKQSGFSSNTANSSSSGSGSTRASTACYTSSGSSVRFYLFDDDDDDKPMSRDETQNRMRNIKSLVQQFFGASSSSTNYSFDSGDMSVLKSWFTELGVSWVLPVTDDGASAVARIQPDHTFDARSWIRALNEIIETIRLTTSFFSDRGFVRMPSICEEEEEEEEEEEGGGGGEEEALAQGEDEEARTEEEEEEEEEVFFRKMVREWPNSITRGKNQIQPPEEAESETESCIPDQFQFARFIQETMLKMLPFVDFLVALDPNTICEFSTASSSGVPAPGLYQKISILLRVLDALSNALFEIEVLHLLTPSAEVKRIRGEMLNLLYAKDNKAAEAVWGTMEEIWARIIQSMEEDGQDSLPPHGSSDIHRVTLSVTSHIRYLWANYWSVTSVVFSLGNGKKHVSDTAGDATSNNPLACLTTEMVSCLEEKLAKRSQSFPDQGLRYLFLINNSSYILQQLHGTYGSNFLHSYFTALDAKIEDYIQAYLELSWAPVLSCLLVNPTPHCFGKNYSPLPKFEHEFEKTYTTQKLWKVPDPELKKTLRNAITMKLVTGYTKYIEDNDVSNPKFSPQCLQEMLQELFEG